MNTKDLFSGHSKLYAAFRPTYPDELYQFIFKHVKEFSAVWDCATGNGQVAQYLCKHFKTVYATDISAQQLEHAYKADNIIYSVSPAEKTSFPDNAFDLITIGQALHWFNVPAFYDEVKRVSKPGAILSAWGYSIPSIGAPLEEQFLHFYKHTVGPYWDPSRKLVDEEYQPLDFPFEEIKAPSFFITLPWTLDHFSGYLESWSAVQKFIKENKLNPVDEFVKELSKSWKTDEVKNVSFPVFLRIAKISK